MPADDAFEAESVYAATFLVEVDGLEIGRFTEVSGLSVEVGVDTYEEGGENGYVHKFPGRMEWPNLTLKRGVTRSDALLSWLASVSGDGFSGAGNKLKRSTAAVTLVSQTGTRLRAWELEGAFPVRWKGPEFALSASDMAYEELEIAHHGFVARKP
ncbi:MAG: phage tail protein [Acidimicrobiia bacterium]|nr:phage tail protein [Acidimicrobiia bacterium]